MPTPDHNLSNMAVEAKQLLYDAIIEYQGQAVGTIASLDCDGMAATNYHDCFIRDFVSAAMVFLIEGDTEIVRNFLCLLVELHDRRKTDIGHSRVSGVMPASFRVRDDGKGNIHLHADYGDMAIGRVTPVDSMLWWLILLGLYCRVTGDTTLASGPGFQICIRAILDQCLRERLEDLPTLLVPDGSFMVDRRLGVYGHPLEIQVLLYAALETGSQLLHPEEAQLPLIKLAEKRRRALCSYLRMFYWLDLPRLNEIHRFDTEEFGADSRNMLNICPQSIPDWLVDWLPDQAGFFVANLGPARMDFRFFAGGNLYAILYGIAHETQTTAILDLYEARWDSLIGAMPVKLSYPALVKQEWTLLTGCDAKNVPWSYHNGGNWPALLQSFVGAALLGGRSDLAERAFALASHKLAREQWPEYYDGRQGRLVGRRANRKQLWSVSSWLVAYHLLQDPGLATLLAPAPLVQSQKNP